MAHLLLRLDTNASARLRGLKPFVLQPEGAVTLELPTGTFSGPIERCRGLVGKRMIRCVLEKYSVKIYNPSVARALNLCARCKYVATAPSRGECAWHARCSLDALHVVGDGAEYFTVSRRGEPKKRGGG